MSSELQSSTKLALNTYREPAYGIFVL